MPSYAPLIIFLLVAAGNFGGMIALTSVLGPKARNPVKDEPFECGSIPVGPNGGKIHIRFYMVAMLFIVFDIETVMMYPCAIMILDASILQRMDFRKESSQLATGLGIVALLGAVFAFFGRQFLLKLALAAPADPALFAGDNVPQVARMLYRQYLFPFEL